MRSKDNDSSGAGMVGQGNMESASSNLTAPKSVMHSRAQNKVDTNDRLFISYARADGSFVRTLYEALAAKGIGAWVDWECIPPSAEWMAEIKQGIDAADAFTFVISPHSLASRVCLKELTHAVKAGKRLIPVVLDNLNPEKAPPELKKLNWIFARNATELPDAVERLISALKTDLAKLRMHARILVRAREWSGHKYDASFLLRGSDLREAETWLAGLDTKGPMPSALHTKYILTSQQAEREEGERWKRLYEQSLARQLAAQSQLLVDQRGTALPLATLLAVEAARRSPSLETDQALRKALALMPFKYGEFSGCHFDATVWADDGERFALSNGKVIEIESISGDRLATLAADQPIRNQPNQVVFSSDGSHVAAVVGDSAICLWRIEVPAACASGEGGEATTPVQPLLCITIEAKAFSIALSRDVSRVAVLTGSHTMLFDTASGTKLLCIEHSEPMVDFALHPGATELAAWGETTAEIWDLATQSRIASWQHMGPATFTMRYSPLGGYLAALQRITFEVSLYHVPTRQLIFSDKRHVDLAFQQQDLGFAIASPEWDIGVYSLPKCERRFRMMHDDSVWQVAFSPDGRRLSSLSKDGTVRVWELERQGREVARIIMDAGTRRTIFSRGSQFLSLLKDKGAELYDAHGFRETRLINTENPVFSVDIAPGTRQIAFGCRNGTWGIVDYEQGEVTALFQGRNAMGEQVVKVALAGDRVLVKQALGSYRLVDTKTREQNSGFGELQAATAAVSQAGAIVAATEQGEEVVKWHAGVVARWKAPSPIRHLACAREGNIVAVLLQDGSVTVLDGDLGVEITQFAGQSGSSIEVDTAGRLLARWESADVESRVWIFDIASAKLRAEWNIPSRINDLRFDATGAQVVLALQDNSVQVWDALKGVEVALFRHDASPECSCFTADGDFVASGGWDGTIRIWPWQQSALIKEACRRLERDLTEAEWAQYLPGELEKAKGT